MLPVPDATENEVGYRPALNAIYRYALIRTPRLLERISGCRDTLTGPSHNIPSLNLATMMRSSLDDPPTLLGTFADTYTGSPASDPTAPCAFDVLTPYA